MRIDPTDLISHPEDVRKIQELNRSVHNFVDFLEWIFDNEVTWMTQTEAWEKFDNQRKPNKEK